MANFGQSATYGQYFGYGTASGMQYDATQNKWVQGTGTGNQQNQQQTQQYPATGQTGAEYYASAADYSGYGNQQYGQTSTQTQQDYSSAMTGTSMLGLGAGNTGNSTGSTSTLGSKTMGNFGSANTAGTVASNSNTNNSAGNGTAFGIGAGTGTAFGMGVTFGNSNAANAANTTMYGAAYGNAQNFGMNNNANAISNTSSNSNTAMSSNTSMSSNTATGSNMATNMNMGGQNFGLGADANTLSQLSQMFGANSGNNIGGDATSSAFGTGYNAFNSGMMNLLQQTLLQQSNNGGAAFGTGNTWGMPDGSGGFYAPPMDTNFQFGAMGNLGAMQGKKGKKWSGKDSKKQEFYGNRFAQMLTGTPGVIGGGKGKRMQDGVRVNIKGEKVVDVEVPLSMYSRWGQLRKFFGKQDTEVIKHLLSFHDEMCEDCLYREQRKKKGHENTSSEQGDIDKPEKSEKPAEPEEMEELSEEDMALRQVMGFGSFNTTRGAMVEGNQVDSTSDASASAKPASDNGWEAKAGFIGPTVPATPSVPATSSEPAETSKPEKPEPEPEPAEEPQSEAGSALSEEEKNIMAKLGWSVFNKKTDDAVDDKSVGDDDNGGDDDEKVNDGGKDGTAAEGTWGAPAAAQS